MYRTTTAVFLLQALALVTVCLAQDTTPPDLVDLQILTPLVDISTGPADVVFTGRAIDDISGMNEVRVYIDDSNGAAFSAVATSFDAAGNFTATATISEFSPTGTYVIQGGRVTDNQINRRIYSQADFIALGFPTTFEVVAAPTLSCIGFEPPVNNGPVTVRGRNRALPLRGQLFDGDGFPVTDLDILAPPVIQVLMSTGVQGEAIDVTSEVLPAGQATDGNQFFYDEDGYWHLNFKTKDYTAPGTYVLFMDTGDDTEYVIDPTCYAEFTRD